MGFIQTAQICQRLRSAADQVSQSWPVMQWQKGHGSASEIVTQKGREPFAGLTFEPGQDVVLRTRLQLPESVAGVPIVGDTLELTIHSLYPMELFWNGTPLFSDSHAPVAAGPALVRVIPHLRTGDNGELSAHIHIPSNRISTRFQRLQLLFTTPRLRARFEDFDLAWAQLTLADFLAQTPEERELVQQAALLVPGEPLLPTSEEILHAAFQRMEEHLAPLAQRASVLQVHLIGHSHIDMNWLWTWQDTVEVIRRDFKSVLALMGDYPELTFTHSQPATYEVLGKLEPELLARVREHIRSGRWEAATMTWVEGDTNMASGEATARQLLEGVRFSREELGIRPSTLLAPDTFGHAGNLPQLARSAGAERYYHHRANPGQADLWPAYWWEGQDGSRLLAVSTPTYNGEITASALVEAAMLASRHGLVHSVHFHGVGDHGGGPASQNLEALRRLQQHSLLPSAACSTLERYSTAILASGTELPVHHGESSTIFEGCYTTHADTKRYNRSGENMLCTADTLAVLVQQDYTAELQTAWRAVLFNQFHDIFDGSAIHESYKKNAEDYAEVASTTHTVIDHALRLLEQGRVPGSIAVTNPLGWLREDWVCAPGWQGQDLVWLSNEQGHRTIGQPTPQGLGFVARVPAFGTVTYQVEQTQEAFSSALQVEASFAPLDERQQTEMIDSSTCPYLRIETPHFRVYLRRDSGILVSFFDKRVDRELVSYGLRKGSDYLDSARADLALNVFQVIEEHPHAMSAWHLDEVHTEHSLLRGATSQVIEVGPARLVVEVQRQFRSSRITQQICFYRDLARVDFQTVLDWQEPGNDQVGIPNLKVAFTARLPECQPWFEIPFAAVQRPSDGQEVPALRWADVGGASYGFALINESKYGYDALGNRLRLTLVRSAYEPDSHADLGSHEFRYSFLPHPGDWRTASIVQTAAGFNQPLLAREVNADLDSRAVLQPGWQLELVPATSSVLLSGLKVAHDRSGTIMRLYESAGQSAQITLHGLPERGRIWETTIVEDRLELLDQQDGVLSLAFQPWQVRTLLLENA
jgi:alpha-mannosidase